VSGSPLGAIFTTAPDNLTGRFAWTPGFGQAGTFTVAFTVVSTQTVSASTTITVANVNREPLAATGGPYSGVIEIPLAFDGSASADPDGDPLSYAWDFGDGSTGTGSKPT